ncbi:MAG: glycoside hydrolase family 92 protein [Parapedobacter sp.]|nr:MAG: glycoside hydrolase family 92 protein [Parapedobacter sp.]
MKISKLITHILPFLCFWMFLLSCQSEQKEDATAYVDPFIGNVAPLENPNRPMVHKPNQMVRVFPNRKDHMDAQLTDFPLSALNTITPQLIFGVKPSTGVLSDTAWYRRLYYDHDREVAKPWYFSTFLPEDQVKVEFTSGNKTGIYRFTFPEGVDKHIVFSHAYPNGVFTLENTSQITGIEYVNDPIHSQEGKAYVYGELSGSPKSGKRQEDKDWGRYTVLSVPEKPKKVAGERAFFSYDARDENVVEFRYAISFISIDQAKRNYEEELTDIDFNRLEEDNKRAWEHVLNQIEVEGGTEGQLRTFYTALYRFYARMIDISENGNYYSGFGKQVYQDDRPFYTDDYTWGNYLAMHPLRTILDPHLQADVLQSYVRMYEQSGWMPEYPKVFGDRPGMFAFHSAIMFLDSYRKGVRDFDAKKALEGLRKNAEQATMLPSRNGPRGALEEFYDRQGYYPALRPGEQETDPFALAKRGQRRSAVAVTLAHSYDDWALSEFAGELGEERIADSYTLKAKNYQHVWRKEFNMFMPKHADGSWIDIDPTFEGGGGDYYNENNGWSYIWQVQHDIRGLADLMGGSEGLERELDKHFTSGIGRSKSQFFSRFTAMTGLIGQFGMGNQLTFFVPYLYNYTSSPWKTQKYTRLILDTWFMDNVLGVPGDEDAGAMSSFVVFSSLGFYPVSPGKPYYAITSPLFEKSTIKLANGKSFVTVAKGLSKKNKYIQAAYINGRKLESLFFHHNDLADGGILELEMGSSISAKWSIDYQD